MDNETLIIVFITATIIATGITVDKAIDNKKTYKKKKKLILWFWFIITSSYEFIMFYYRQ